MFVFICLFATSSGELKIFINNNFILFICPKCTKTNNSEQIVGQDSKATQDALITARINYKPNETNRNTIKTHNINTYRCTFLADIVKSDFAYWYRCYSVRYSLSVCLSVTFRQCVQTPTAEVIDTISFAFNNNSSLFSVKIRRIHRSPIPLQSLPKIEPPLLI